MFNYDSSEKEDEKQENYIFLKVLQSHKTKIAEIRKACELIINLLDKFKEIYPSINIELDKYYRILYKLIDENKESIESEIDYKYNQNDGKDFPNFYINTDILKYLSNIPFQNLYESPMNGENLDWESIQNKLNACYAQIDDIFSNLDTKDIKTLPHQKLFDEISNFLEKDNSSNFIKTNENEFALRLYLKNDLLCLTGFAINGKIIPFHKIRKGPHSLILDLTLKACSNKPAEFKSITKSMLESKTKFANNDLINALEDIAGFRKYISNIGLKGKLKSCFFGNSNSDLGFIFKTAVNRNQWNELNINEQESIINTLVNIKAKEA